ncbi:hypothetical protein PG994_003698 [Apiospora phragmitis]|uniref:YMC020W-like alpha/beta hydrolase domain-containing protein n=1 Tax=Apiospora phragmitis TaxID=2905665 RepID=A0ABR1VYU2_9PEZI
MAPRKRPRPNPSESSAANTTSLPVSLVSNAATLPISFVSRLTGSTRRDRSASQPNDPAATTASSTASSTTAASPSPPEASQSSQMQREGTDESQAPEIRPTEEPQLVAREYIMGGTVKGPLADFSRYDTKKSPDASGDSDTQSIKTLPKATESEAQLNGNDSKKIGTDIAAPSEQPAASSGWFGWLAGSTTTQENAHQDPEQTNKTPAATQVPETVTQQETPKPLQDEISQPVSATPNQIRPTNSWFGWFGTPTALNDEPNGTSPTQPEAQNKKEDEVTVTTDAPPTSIDHTPSPVAGSTWAFWSRDSGPKADGKATTSQEQGELAVMGDGSESSPRRSVGVDVGDTTKPKEQPLKQGSKDTQAKNRKRIRPEIMGIDETGPTRPETPINKTAPARPETPTSAKAPSIKKAIAIGVHGLFPASFLRPVIGQPTGTSLRFANHCAEAIRRWADSHGCADCEIEKVALESEGKIGVPVGVMLAAKLIELGIVTTARIGICAMAGVCLGPFPDYKSGMGMIMGSAAELWQFSDPESEVSKRLERSLRIVLERGTRITYIGSIDDQLVPMESAIYSPASHPYIYRAVFIDGRLHAPDFIAHLVGFALKLRNLGISDQGLIRELSVALAGSLYSGEGHSRLYDDESVYDLSVSHTLETTVVNNVSCNIEKHTGLTNPNPYVLPWIMRGLLEEDIVKTELSGRNGGFAQAV